MRVCGGYLQACTGAVCRYTDGRPSLASTETTLRYSFTPQVGAGVGGGTRTRVRRMADGVEREVSVRPMAVGVWEINVAEMTAAFPATLEGEVYAIHLGMEAGSDCWAEVTISPPATRCARATVCRAVGASRVCDTVSPSVPIAFDNAVSLAIPVDPGARTSPLLASTARALPSTFPMPLSMLFTEASRSYEISAEALRIGPEVEFLPGRSSVVTYAAPPSCRLHLLTENVCPVEVCESPSSGLCTELGPGRELPPNLPESAVVVFRVMGPGVREPSDRVELRRVADGQVRTVSGVVSGSTPSWRVLVSMRSIREGLSPELAEVTYQVNVSASGASCSTGLRLSRPGVLCPSNLVCSGERCVRVPPGEAFRMTTEQILVPMSDGREAPSARSVVVRRLSTNRAESIHVESLREERGWFAQILRSRIEAAFGTSAASLGVVRVEWLSDATAPGACSTLLTFPGADGDAAVAPRDASRDVSLDGIAADAQSDLGADASLDLGSDTLPESGFDAPVDARLDAAPDVPPDASPDVPPDAAPDVPPDAPVDAVPADAEPAVCPTSNPAAGTSLMLGTGSGLFLNRRLAVGIGYVAWADGRSLLLAPADGSSPAITVDTGAVTAIAFSGADLYWVQATAADRAQLKRRPVAAPASEAPTNVSLSLRIVNNLVVTADFIFALDDYNGRLIAAPRGREHLSFPLANLATGGQFRNMTLLREGGADRLIFERYAFGAPCYQVQSVPVPPVDMQPTYPARTDYEPAPGTSCTAASFYGLAADARGAVFHDPSGLPSVRALPPPERLGGGRGDGTGVGLWGDCAVVYNGAGYTAVERGGSHRTRALAGSVGGALFAVTGGAVYAVLGGTGGSLFSVVRIEL